MEKVRCLPLEAPPNSESVRLAISDPSTPRVKPKVVRMYHTSRLPTCVSYTFFSTNILDTVEGVLC